MRISWELPLVILLRSAFGALCLYVEFGFQVDVAAGSCFDALVEDGEDCFFCT